MKVLFVYMKFDREVYTSVEVLWLCCTFSLNLFGIRNKFEHNTRLMIVLMNVLCLLFDPVLQGIRSKTVIQ